MKVKKPDYESHRQVFYLSLVPNYVEAEKVIAN